MKVESVKLKVIKGNNIRNRRGVHAEFMKLKARKRFRAFNVINSAPSSFFKTSFSLLISFSFILSINSCSPETGGPTGERILHAETRRVAHIPLPRGYQRTHVKEGSFAEFLRKLPLKNPGSPVRYYNGQLKPNQSIHAAVINIDTGNRDLQQCADAVMRLRAEYLFRNNKKNKITFNLTSGHASPWRQWARGYRPVIRGSRVRFVLRSRPDYSYKNLRRYMNHIFAYAGTLSLAREMHRVHDVLTIKPGHVFIQGGSPGHAVLVIDSAVDRNNGRKIFLLAQSYMPAQSIHVLKNPADNRLSPWYRSDFGAKLVTPEWIFKRKDLKRF